LRRNVNATTESLYDSAEAIGGLSVVIPDWAAIAEEATKVKKLPVRWLVEGELPGLAIAGGTAVDAGQVRHLLHRQSLQKDCVPDPSVVPLYTAIDRDSAGLLRCIF
jgi:hypothetical protein